MLLRSFLLLSAVAATSPLAAQQRPDATAATAFQARRAELDRRGMLVLGGWAVGNVSISGARYFATEGP